MVKRAFDERNLRGKRIDSIDNIVKLRTADQRISILFGDEAVHAGQFNIRIDVAEAFSKHITLPAADSGVKGDELAVDVAL